MATRGIPQLRRLTLTHCEHSGASAGARVLARAAQGNHPSVAVRAGDLGSVPGKTSGRYASAAGAEERAAKAAAALARFRRLNPLVDVQFLRRNGRAPVLYGDYLTGTQRQIDVSNADSERILERFGELRDQTGNKNLRKVGAGGRKLGRSSRSSSVQGVWEEGSRALWRTPYAQQ